MDDHEPYLDVPVAWGVPGWARTLANLYWRLRAVRKYNQAARRKWYRYIRRERDYLEQQGVDSELVRLACRYLNRPQEGNALDRLLAFELVVIQLHRIQGLVILEELGKRRVETFYPDLRPEFRTRDRQHRPASCTR